MQWFFTNQTRHANQFFNFAHHWNWLFLPDLTGHVQHVTSMFLDFHRTHWKHLLFYRWLLSVGTTMQIIINMTKDWDAIRYERWRHAEASGPPHLRHHHLQAWCSAQPAWLVKKWWFLHQAMHVWIYHDLSIHSMYIFNIFNVFYPSWAPILDSGADPKSSKMDRKSWP